MRHCDVTKTHSYLITLLFLWQCLQQGSHSALSDRLVSIPLQTGTRCNKASGFVFSGKLKPNVSVGGRGRLKILTGDVPGLPQASQTFPAMKLEGTTHHFNTGTAVFKKHTSSQHCFFGLDQLKKLFNHFFARCLSNTKDRTKSVLFSPILHLPPPVDPSLHLCLPLSSLPSPAPAKQRPLLFVGSVQH